MGSLWRYPVNFLKSAFTFEQCQREETHVGNGRCDNKLNFVRFEPSFALSISGNKKNALDDVIMIIVITERKFILFGSFYALAYACFMNNTFQCRNYWNRVRIYTIFIIFWFQQNGKSLIFVIKRKYKCRMRQDTILFKSRRNCVFFARVRAHVFFTESLSCYERHIIQRKHQSQQWTVSISRIQPAQIETFICF